MGCGHRRRLVAPLLGALCAALLATASIASPRSDISQPTTPAGPLALSLAAAIGGSGARAVATMPDHVLVGMGPRLLILGT